MAQEQKLSQSVPVMFLAATLVVVVVSYLMVTRLAGVDLPQLASQSTSAEQAKPEAADSTQQAQPDASAQPTQTAEQATTPPESIAATEQPSADQAAGTALDVGEQSPAPDQTVSEAAEQPLQSLAAPEQEGATPAADTATSGTMPATGTAATPSSEMASATPEPSAPPPGSTASTAEPAGGTAPASSSQPTGGSVASTDTAPAAAFEREGAAAKTSKELQELGLKDSQWLLSQSASQYTIQLVAAQNEKDVGNFVRKNEQLPKDQLAYYQRKTGGQDWVVLVSGSYPSLKAAVEAMNGLPDGAKARNPWVRKLSAVHKDIQAN